MVTRQSVNRDLGERQIFKGDPLDVRELRGGEEILAKAGRHFPKVRGILDEAFKQSFDTVTDGVSVLNLEAAFQDPSTRSAYERDFGRRVNDKRLRLQAESRVGLVKLPGEDMKRLKQEFEKDKPLKEWAVEGKEARDKVLDDVVYSAVAYSIMDSDAKIDTAADMTSQEVLRTIRKAVGEKKKAGKKGDDFSAAQYLADRGINRKTLSERGFGQDGSQPWHTGPDGQGLEVLMPLGLENPKTPIEGQPPGGPKTVFDGEWSKLGYRPGFVEEWRESKDTWWHTAETTMMLALHSNTEKSPIGKKPGQQEIDEERKVLEGFLGNENLDSFKELTNRQAYKPVLDKVGIGLEKLLDSGVDEKQAMRLGYSPKIIQSVKT